MNKELTDKLAERLAKEFLDNHATMVSPEYSSTARYESNRIQINWVIDLLNKAINQATSELQAENSQLQVEVARLREALKPFAKFSELAHIGYEYRQRMTIAVPNPEATVPHRAETWLGSNQFKAAQKALTSNQSTTLAYTQRVRAEAIKEMADKLDALANKCKPDDQGRAENNRVYAIWLREQYLLTKKEGE